jgi:dinuclear metal center YbgI/SA1388 family protein
MICSEIIKEIENWAPKETAWQKDNVGLQVGSLSREVKNILLCLELNNTVLDEAVKKDCSLVITHHPLLFLPVKRIDVDRDRNSMLIERLIKHDITLYSAHTNLDYTKNGVSFILAGTLGLNNIKFLDNLKSNQYKISVFVPADFADKTASAIFNAGGGIIGDYSECSFRTEGTGTFKGNENTKPARGEKGRLERVNEVKLEVIVDSWKLGSVIKAIYKVHPYEEIAYDVIPLHNVNANYGAGAFGELEKPMPVDIFLEHVSKSLKAKGLKYSRGKNKQVKKVAVCGGSGIEYLDNAIAAGADAYITADVRYHSFQDAEDRILLVDAGHYETEVHVLNEVKRRLDGPAKKAGIKVFKYSGSTNPVNFYNN